MLTEFHMEIMFEALGDQLGARALAVMTKANIRQDRFTAQFWHDEFHFDNNAFKKTHEYIEEQRSLTVDALNGKDVAPAWQAFGRMSHTVQDFYAHSNYVHLWLDRFNGSPPPAPPEIDPVDPALLDSPRLRTGKTYPPLEWLYYVKRLRPYVLPLIPRDSHAWMNLDAPAQGFKFDYAMQAAIKRTRFEFEKTLAGLPRALISLFVHG